jgi:hypothetical protein
MAYREEDGIGHLVLYPARVRGEQNQVFKRWDSFNECRNCSHIDTVRKKKVTGRAEIRMYPRKNDDHNYHYAIHRQNTKHFQCLR